MSGANPYFLAAFVLYLILLMVIAAWAARRTRNVMDFWVFGQKMGPTLATWSLIANFVSAVSVIGFTGAVYASGYSLMTHTILGLMLGVSGLYFVVGLVRRLNVLTFPDLVARVTGKQAARPLAGSVLLLSGWLYLVMQLVGAGLLVAATTGVPYKYMVWILGIVFILYTATGGLVSVAWTDLVQGVIMVGAVVIALGYMIVDLGGLTEINARFAAMDPSFVDPTGGGQLSWAVIGATFLAFFGTIFTEQDMLIRIAATRDVRTAKIHLAASGAILSVFYALLVLLGGATAVALVGSGMGVENPDAAFPTLITRYVPTWIGVALVLGVMSAILSTTDTRLHAIGMTVARDIYSYFRPRVGEAHLLRVSRAATVLLGLLATAAAMDPPGTIIVLYGFRAVLLTSAFFLPVYIAIYWTALDGRAVLAAIVAGAVVGLGAQVAGGSIGPVPATFCGVGAAVTLLLVAHWALGPRRRRESALAAVAADEGVG
jgi:sodium/proline symporter